MHSGSGNVRSARQVGDEAVEVSFMACGRADVIRHATDCRDSNAFTAELVGSARLFREPVRGSWCGRRREDPRARSVIRTSVARGALRGI